ncbi:MAG: hypothetical protein IJX89_00150 [Alphaproteobacteria bacterium]|nr:hypothetical protein [Alphaproteobacteria bacterium]
MNWLKKFWIVFLSFLPFGAGAVAPWIIGAVAGIGAIAGFSIYRSGVPVDMADAMQFFSSCWTCQMFSDVMSTMSNLLPKVYHALGTVIIPMSAALMAIWFAWKLLQGFLNSKLEDPWSITHNFTNNMIKFGVMCALLLAPLPRMVSEILVEPVFSVGLSLNHVVTSDVEFDTCLVATAVADPVSVDARAAAAGAFSPKLRHNLACELANVHQMTGLGMTVGWTMLNMAFDADYMHKIMWDIPIFPNVPIFFAGVLVLVLFFMALLPIPMYFLEIFIELAMDLIMLPLMLMSWLFKDWKLFPQSGMKTIQKIINDVITGAVGIAMVGIFVTFAIMFLDAVFGGWAGASTLATALAQNDSKYLMDALMMRNDSLITIILMGLFITMFMTMIPALVKTIFNVSISQDYYDTAKKNINIVWQNLKKWYAAIKK